MNDQLKVSLENIIPLTEARDHFSQIVAEVQKDKLYVLTKGGKPAVAIIDVKYLEAITGGQVRPEHVESEIQKNPAKVGRIPMIEHSLKMPDTTTSNIPPTPVKTAVLNQTPAPKPEKTALPPEWYKPTTPTPPKPAAPATPPPPAAAPTPPPKPAAPTPLTTPPVTQTTPAAQNTPAPKPTSTPAAPTAPAPKPAAPGQPTATIEVTPSPDDEQIAKNEKEDNQYSDGSKSEDNQVGPAQYAGEPKDMSLD